MNSQLKFILTKQLANKKKLDGFTLVELLIVVVVLGILSGVALPNFLSQRDRASVGAANAQASALVTACEIDITNGLAPGATGTLLEELSNDYKAAVATTDDAVVTAAAADITASACTFTVEGTAVNNNGTFTSFGAKTPATV